MPQAPEPTLYARMTTALMARPFVLLVLTALFWGGNAVAGKLAVGEISPLALTCLRWVLVCAMVWPLVYRDMPAVWPVIRGRWPSVVAMGALGFTVFNALFYLAAHHTTGINLTIIQGSIPVFVLIAAVPLFGTRILPLQYVGVFLTLVGVALTAAHGDLSTLASLSFNIGDVWMLMASVLYAGYTLALRNRPPLPGLLFFAAMAIVACITSIPLLIWEIAVGQFQMPTLKGLAILFYVALFPSFVAQVFFMRGVEKIGPGRAGLFVNLVPVFGSLLSVVILGEYFGLYHAVALALVLGGIYVSERGKR